MEDCQSTRRILSNIDELESFIIYKHFVGQKLNLNTTLTAVPKPTTNLVQIAKQQLGVKYSFGGAKPSTGFDCSGYITFVYNNAGISTPRKTAAGFYNSAKKSDYTASWGLSIFR